MTDQNNNTDYTFTAELHPEPCTEPNSPEETSQNTEAFTSQEGTADSVSSQGSGQSAEQTSEQISEHSSDSAASGSGIYKSYQNVYSTQAPQPQTIYYVPTGEPPKKKKKNHRFARAVKKTVSFIACACLFGAVAGGTFIGVNSLYYRYNPEKTQSNPFVETQDNADASIRPTILSTGVASGTAIATADVSDIVESAMPSLVSISCTFKTTSSFFGYLYEGTTEGSGSGIIVGNNGTELLIATNNHVVNEATSIKVTFSDGETVDAVTKGTARFNDLAIVSVPVDSLKKETLNSITIAKLGNSDEVKVGQMVIAIGNALGYGQTTTVGYISAKEREITSSDSNTGYSATMKVLQVDAAINPGNSGGALLNTKGEVIGINSAKLSDTAVEGIGYAIPISSVSDILTDLMNREILTDDERGYLGVYLSNQDITEEVSKYYGWPVGVYITDTTPNGAAAKAGILAGDIITHVNSVKVAGYSDLQERIASLRSGSTVAITIQRLLDGEWVEMNFDITLGSKVDFD